MKTIKLNIIELKYKFIKEIYVEGFQYVIRDYFYDQPFLEFLEEELNEI